MSGDTRRALELCRKAAEIAQEEQSAGVPSAAAAAPGSADGAAGPSTPPKSPGAHVLFIFFPHNKGAILGAHPSPLST